MKKIPMLILALLAWLSTGFSQPEMPVLVVETTGKVKCKTEQGKCIRLEAGTALKKGATLKVKKNSSVVLMHNNQFVKVDAKGKHNLADLFKDQGSTAFLNFDAVFAEFSKASMAMAQSQSWSGEWEFDKNKNLGDGWGVNDPPGSGGWGANDPTGQGGWGVNDPPGSGGWGVNDPGSQGGWGVNDPPSSGGWGVSDPKSTGGWGVSDPKSTGGWGTTDPPGTGGWGVNDPGGQGGWSSSAMKMEPSVPGGVYKAEKTEFKWIDEAGADKYLFCVFDEDLNLVHKQEAGNTSATVDLASLNLDTDKTYYWQTMAHLQEKVSIPVTFTVADAESMEMVSDAVADSEISDQVGPELKGMMEAVALERSRMFLSAQKKYNSLMSAYPKNNLVKLNYAAFCRRMGQTNMAKKVAEEVFD